jgi:hypothetical protein
VQVLRSVIFTVPGQANGVSSAVNDILYCCLPKNAAPINRRSETSSQGRYVYLVIAANLFTSYHLIITDAIAIAHWHLDGIIAICTGEIVPLATSGIQFTAKEG